MMLAEFEKRLLFRDSFDIRQTLLSDFLDTQMDMEDAEFEKRMKNIKEAIERRAKREALAEEEKKRLEEEAAAAAAEEEVRRKKQEQQQRKFNQNFFHQQQRQQYQHNRTNGSHNNGYSRSNNNTSSSSNPFEQKQKESLDILELNDVAIKDLTEDILKHKFRKLSLKWHPDRWSGAQNTDKRVEAEEKMKKINEANQFLRENVLML